MKNINFRLPVIIALSVALGCVVTLFLIYFKTEILYVTAAIAVAAVVFVIFLILRLCRAAVYTAIALIFFFAGVLACYFTLTNYSKVEIDSSQNHIVYGRVTERVIGENYDYVIIDNLICDRSTPIHGKARVNVDKNQTCERGYTVSFTALLTRYDTFGYGKLNYSAAAGIKYRASEVENLKSQYGFDLFGSANQAIKNTLFNNLSYETAAVVCAITLGESEMMDGGLLQTFRQGGIAHLFAVSGLHIGLIYSAIWFILRKLRLNKIPVAAISLAAVFLYAGICGFTISSVRAAIMCTVLALTSVTGNKHDRLNSLAFSVIIILLINPLSLFTAGFQLSVCAVGGMCLTATKISSLLKKIKIPRKLSDAAGATIGAQLGTTPAMLISFGYVSGAGLILNILVVPIISILYAPLFLGVIASALIPHIAQAIVPVVAAPLQAFITFITLFGFENTLISGFGAGAFIPLYFIFLLLISDKINLRLIARIIAVSVAVIITVTYCITETFAPFNGYKVVVSSKHGDAVLIKSAQGTVIIVTRNTDDGIKRLLSEYYSINPQAVIILGNDECVNTADDLNLECPFYVWEDYLNAQTDVADIEYVREITLCGANFEFYDGHTVTADLDGVEICVSASGGELPENCRLLVSRYPGYSSADYKINFTRQQSYLNAYDCGDIIFEINNGILKCNSLLYSPN